MPKQFVPEPQTEWLEAWEALGRAESACCGLSRKDEIHFRQLFDNLRDALNSVHHKLLKLQRAPSLIPNP